MADGILKVGTITTSSGSGTITLGQSGETLSVPSGATINLSNATQTGVGGVMTPAFQAKITSRQNLSNTTSTKVAFNSADINIGSCFDTSNNRFLPTTAGKYFIGLSLVFTGGAATSLLGCYSFIYKNGSGIQESYFDASGNRIQNQTLLVSSIIDMNGSSDYVEGFGYINTNSSGSLEPNTYTRFFGYKIIE